MEADEVFIEGLAAFGDVVDAVPGEGWDAPSPCAGWSARDVLGHLGTSVGMGASFLAGEQPTFPEADRPGDLVPDDPAAWWHELADRARAALAGADLDLVMETPMGPRTVRDRLAFPAIDLYVHAWDIGRATGVPVEVPQDVIDFAHRYIDPLPAEMVRRPGIFDPEQPAPADATPTEAFVAWSGRAAR